MPKAEIACPNIVLMDGAVALIACLAAGQRWMHLNTLEDRVTPADQAAMYGGRG